MVSSRRPIGRMKSHFSSAPRRPSHNGGIKLAPSLQENR
jgi:hypothetical protein